MYLNLGPARPDAHTLARLLDRLFDNAPCLVLQQLAIGRHEDNLQPALQDFLKRQAVAHRLRNLGVATAHDDKDEFVEAKLGLW